MASPVTTGRSIEIGRVSGRYDDRPWNGEAKIIYGFERGDWVFATNANIGFTLSSGPGSRPVELEFATKVNYKVNDNWLYLPALNKVKRVVSIKDSKDSGSYFGSEFYIEDLEDPRLEDYTYKILGEENVKVLEVGKGYVESPAYILEWMPTNQRKGTTNYGKMVMWVDKKRFILLKGEFYDHDGVLFKRRTIKNLQFVDGNWMPRQVTMDNMTTRRVTVMDRLALAIGMDVDDEYLTQRTLTDHAYRERYLSQFRSLWKN